MKLLLLKENDFCILRFLENANAKKMQKKCNAKFFSETKKKYFSDYWKKNTFYDSKKIFPIQRYIGMISTEII